MALVALDGTPLVIVGSAGREGGAFLPIATGVQVDAVNEACIMVGQIFTEDGASHTLNTSGSSSMGWRAGTVVFANAGTTVKVGLAAVETAAGPPVRAVNAADVITFDVSASFTGGGGGIVTNSWQENVPNSGTKTVANGDLVAFCVQMTARGGTDAVSVTVGSTVIGIAAVMPTVTGFLGGSYASQALIPNAVITFSDGVLGFFYGGCVFSVPNTTQTWNSTSGTKEYGNYFQLPVPGNVYGIAGNTSIDGDVSFVLYSNPLGTPVAERTLSFDANAIGTAANNRFLVGLFSSPYSFTAGQALAAIMKPTSATSISGVYTTLNSSAHQKAYTLGTNGYAINRASGAFAAQNSNKDRYAIGLLVGAFDAGGGSAGGISRARAASGF